MKLFIRALLKFIFGFLLLSCLLFLPAGTLAYPNAWLFLGLLPFALYPIILVIRIRNEETVLSRNLPGYTEYRKKVKYRLIPFIW